ncbi:MAG TPA: TIGR03557 family F420-dependent LLM class oxidoreductase [Candidatus Eisenbacteria bacterium]|nr:TIGR03557 family F420-dependent LLM class oxidoreductase [Candidatus Eisenbacteria bacterium]
MLEIGYKLCSEEQSPRELIAYAKRAEAIGFKFAMVSDHYHPWLDRQGQSSFVWSVLGGIAQATERIKIGTAVTCPTMRIHPAVIAQAAATAAAMLPRRFLFGVGTGENLNEHIIGAHWPEAQVRREMLSEAVELIRRMWRGGRESFRSRYYTVESARLYTLPEEPPPILVAAGGKHSAELAGRIGDGLITTAPAKSLRQQFEQAGGNGKPCFAEMTVCWAENEQKARQTALECWPVVSLKGELMQVLPLPAHFEQAAKMVREEDVAQMVVCGPDPAQHVERLREYERAGFENVFVHQIGPDQEGFFRFYEREILPRFGARSEARDAEAQRPRV